MSDFLLDLAQNKSARSVIRTLGLPVPLPPQLERPTGPRYDTPLAGRFIAVAGEGELTARLQDVAKGLGAEVSPEAEAPHGLLFDATGLTEPDQLKRLYDFFRPALGRLQRNGRVVIIGRPPEGAGNAVAAATQYALDGFVRSLGKEIGALGASANLLYVQSGAEPRLEGPLRFLLTERAAYVSGQALRITRVAKGPAAGPWSRPLAGKVALVTGAARGIGETTARVLAAEGARVICLDRPQDEKLVHALAESIGGTVLLADVTDESAGEHIISGIGSSFDGLDILVHNAGITRDKTLRKMSPEYWDQVMAVNLRAITRLTPQLLEGPMRDNARIVCLSSIAGIAGNFGQTNYAATKAGVIGYVEAMAPALGKRGITINAVAPGFIETRLTQAIPVMVREIGRRMNAFSQGGLPRDIAEAVAFLSSPGSVGVTGATLRVCGLSIAGR